ncbi:MAG: SUF system Fe-S cluster assembly protein [Pseudomonadota bacterium]|uniref:SUF system Fe-S cluster assembly protein n=1 Tax=Rhizorhabdus phycosphaerae TaxID=2711156 RepID=UPI0013E9A093|nr:SUF system Fe-S cluster assembly protein [Rhizorhabdus phycosphaerae]
MMDERTNDSGKILTEEVESVTPPPRVRVDLEALDADRPAEQPPRKPDYLDGFLAQRPQADAAGEPGGEIYEGVITALKEIYDPEIPVNIYDLGLVYGVEVADNAHVVVTMTLTTPHCPVAESMPGEVELRVGAVPGVGSAEVNLIWDPPWDPQKMSDEAKLELGML